MTQLLHFITLDCTGVPNKVASECIHTYLPANCISVPIYQPSLVPFFPPPPSCIYCCLISVSLLQLRQPCASHEFVQNTNVTVMIIYHCKSPHSAAVSEVPAVGNIQHK